MYPIDENLEKELKTSRTDNEPLSQTNSQNRDFLYVIHLTLVAVFLLLGGLVRPAAGQAIYWNVPWSDMNRPLPYTRVVIPVEWGGRCAYAPGYYPLPEARSQGEVNHTLSPTTLPDGLWFESGTSPMIMGHTTEVTPPKTYTLTATDSDGNRLSHTFTLEVVDERAILEEFYTATGGDEWTTNTNWGSAISVCPGELYGVTDEAVYPKQGYVYALDLSDNNLTGSIPASLGKLTGLLMLDLSDNNLTGPIPDMSGLTDLFSLDLKNNGLTGSIPASVGNLVRLDWMDLSHNNLTGSIPASVGTIFLHRLNLSYNRLSGSIPASLGNLDFVDEVNLAYNQLSGSIPASLGNLTEVGELLLRYNRLSGAIPKELGNLTDISWLDLAHNQLSGAIPGELGNLTGLTFLYLEHNRLSGAIPKELGNLTSLQVLRLGHNRLSGAVPEELSALSTGCQQATCGCLDLVMLELQHNQLTSVSDGISLPALELLDLRHNRLTSPPDVNNMPSLLQYRLYGNAALDLADLDQPTPVSLAVTPTTVSEGDGTVTVNVTLTLAAALESDVTVPVMVYSGTAYDEWDFTTPGPAWPFSFFITITAGETTATGAAEITLVDDQRREGSETFWVELALYLPHEVQPGDTTGVLVTINDNDGSSSGSWSGGGGGGGSRGGNRGGNRGGDNSGSSGSSGSGDTVAPTPPPAGNLENPEADSFQSGLGVISGWVCEADEVEIVIETAGEEVARIAAAYGTERADTEEGCGDADNGFGLLLNWNELGDGAHEVVALVDGIEVGRAPVTVTTLGAAFVRDVAGTCTVEDFPSPGETVTVVWQEANQNFVLTDGAVPSGLNRAGSPDLGFLENPGPNSFQSGLGVISGWVCEADEVEIVIETAGEEVARIAAAYGTERADTAGVCGDTDTGFGLLFNWNELGDGEHTVVALVDEAELGWATVQVTTLGEAFVRGVAGACLVEGFPQPGQAVTLEWQEAQQNFVITGRE